MQGNCRPENPSAWPSFLMALLYLLVVLALFSPAIWGQRIFAYRDAAYWYLPTLDWTSRQLAGGQFPLWNDWHGLGTNWIGQGTTAVFYPGTWLLALPLGRFESRYAIVLALHVWLSGLLCFRFARSFNCGPTASALAGLSYGFAAPVLIQHTNWPFLIGATWLPLAMEGLWRILGDPSIARTKRFSLQWTIITAIALSLMIFGGEPQAVYLWAIAAAILLLLQGCGDGWNRRNTLTGPTQQRLRTFSATRKTWAVVTGRWMSGAGQLALVLIFCTAAALIQLWPLVESAQHSTRVLRDRPENLYQWLAAEPAAPLSDFLAAPTPGSALSQSLQFSQPPWLWSTLIAGNTLGTWRQVNARWEQQLAASERNWNPSLYLGLIPFLLALHGGLRTLALVAQQVSRRRKKKSSTDLAPEPIRPLAVFWLQALVLVFGLGSLGWYGGGWLILEAKSILGENDLQGSWAPQAGGVYWWLQLSLPGFSQFRYPAKLWVLASLSLSILAALEFQRWHTRREILQANVSAEGNDPRRLAADHSTHDTATLDTATQDPATDDTGINATGINDTATDDPTSQLLLTVTAMLLFCLLVFGVSLLDPFRNFFVSVMQNSRIDPWIGALNIPQALLEIHLSWLQAIVVAGIFCLWLHWLPSRRANPHDRSSAALAEPHTKQKWAGLNTSLWCNALLCVCLLDLIIANQWMLITVERTAIGDLSRPGPPSRAADLSGDDAAASSSLGHEPEWLRTVHHPDLQWQHRQFELHRKWGNAWPWQAVEKLNWQALRTMKLTRAPQFHLSQNVASINPEFTLYPANATLLGEIASGETAGRTAGEGQDFWRDYLRTMGVTHLWTARINPPPGKAQNLAATDSGWQFHWQTLPSPSPPFWVCEQWHFRAAVDTWDRAARIADLREIWLSDERAYSAQQELATATQLRWNDLQQSLTLTSDPGLINNAPVGATQQEGQSVLVDWKFDHQRKTAMVDLAVPSVVGLRQTFDPGWRCWAIDPTGQGEWHPTFEVNRCFTGVILPPGRYELRWIYRPDWWVWGGSVSLLTWSAFAAFGLECVRRRLSQKLASKQGG